MIEDINYIIEETNTEHGYIIFKPYSKNFKKQLNEYPSYKIDVNTISYADDPRLYLASISKPIIDEILEKEKNYASEIFLKAFDGMEKQTITVSNDEIANNKIVDLINYDKSTSSNLNFIIS